MSTVHLHSSETKVVKRLFSPSPNKKQPARLKREPLTRSNCSRNGFGIGVCGSLAFLLLCAGVVVLTARLNNGWPEITIDDVKRFFSNELLRYRVSDNGSYLDKLFHFNGQLLFGYLGALPLAAIVGVACGSFTWLFMFYDSEQPGSFPPTPVSSQKKQRGEPVKMSLEWHLGYLFVPINFLVAFSLALFFMRWHMGLPML